MNASHPSVESFVSFHHISFLTGSLLVWQQPSFPNALTHKLLAVQQTFCQRRRHFQARGSVGLASICVHPLAYLPLALIFSWGPWGPHGPGGPFASCWASCPPPSWRVVSFCWSFPQFPDQYHLQKGTVMVLINSRRSNKTALLKCNLFNASCTLKVVQEMTIKMIQFQIIWKDYWGFDPRCSFFIFTLRCGK